MFVEYAHDMQMQVGRWTWGLGEDGVAEWQCGRVAGRQSRIHAPPMDIWCTWKPFAAATAAATTEYAPTSQLTDNVGGGRIAYKDISSMGFDK